MPESPTGRTPELDRLCIDAIKVLSMDAVQQAASGHPGTPMALGPVGYLLWTQHVRHNPTHPQWLDRDRFVLSLGHASMLVYSLLHLSGYDLSVQDLKDFRQWGSKTPGHPEVGHTPGVETTTGPLGQGVANSVGMAMAERWLASRFNRSDHSIVDHNTYVICSDGDLMEGLSHEAAALAGHQKLGKLMWIWDDNDITIEGSTNLATSTDQAARFRAYGWHVQTVEDGSNLQELHAAIEAAKAERERPSFIAMKTRIADGSPNKVGTAGAHGAPLGAEEIAATKTNLGYPSQEAFFVPEEASAAWREAVPRGAALESEWSERFAAYSEAHPELAAEFTSMMAGELPSGWDADLPDFAEADAGSATRSWSGKVIQGLARGIPNFIGGSADLGGSNKTDIDDAESLLAESPGGRVVHFGIREHAMASVMNGMVLHGGVRPFGGTFLIFSDYMRPAIRMAALMGLPVTYVFTHDSIGVGEDGPTHQPVEQLMSLRLIPNLVDLRPADGPETAEAWRFAVENTSGPSFLSLTRQTLPTIDRSEPGAAAAGLRRGAYVLKEAASGAPSAILIASGSEVSLALEARLQLEAEGIATRVVSMPSWSLFARQDAAYRDGVLPPAVRNRVAVEAGHTAGWERWIGEAGTAVGIDHFGASAPAPTLFEEFGITVAAVVKAAHP